MAFKSWFTHSEDACDKCGKPATAERPAIYLKQTSKNDTNVIIMHIDCIQKLIRKADVSMGL